MLPEEIELDKKQRVIDRLSERLASREEEMADLRAELERFEARYKMDVGRLYADFDEIEALIAEEEAKLVPDDEEIKKRAEELRRRAEESAARAETDITAVDSWQPTAEAKRAYRDLARAMHPDLALDPAEKQKRHALMSQLNHAYSSGDQKLLDKLAEDYRFSPEFISGTSPGVDLVRSIRQIYQVKVRLTELSQEKETAQASELFTLYQQAQAELSEGRDLLAQMAERTRTHIKKSERRLENLRRVNAAQEEHVKETFGLDISEFR